MGRKRTGAKKAPKKNFKVVGAKSLKAKNRPKAVKTELKSLNKAANKRKLQEVDEQLVKLQDKVVQKPAPKKSKAKGRKGKSAKARETKRKTTQETAAVADKLEKMDV